MTDTDARHTNAVEQFGVTNDTQISILENGQCQLRFRRPDGEPINVRLSRSQADALTNGIEDSYRRFEEDDHAE